MNVVRPTCGVRDYLAFGVEVGEVEARRYSCIGVASARRGIVLAKYIVRFRL
jgi:hypothetical protein